METLALLLIALLWGGGTGLRVYRQARYYQIEEYKMGRYLRWWLAQRDTHLLPRRPLNAGVVGLVLSVVFSEGGWVVPAVIALIAGAAAVVPPPLGEVKKPFRATDRAKRLLAASFSLTALLSLGALLLVTALPFAADLRVTAMTGLALLLFLSAPLLLVAGNLLMIPVESGFRRFYLRQARAVMQAVQPAVIGITGSYGKTTTKTFLADILNGRFRAYATPKSFNTMMGVSLAINRDLRDNYAIDYFVVEMGAYIRGEIERICGLTPPDISIVTEVGPQHLERFGSLENIATAKYEIIKALPADGVGVFNYDNPYVRAMMDRGYPATRLGVSRAEDAALLPLPPEGPRFIATAISEGLDGLRFIVTDRQSGTSQTFETAVLGIHNVTNILLAAAVAVHEGMTLSEIAFRVRALKPAESRLVRQTTPEGITLINDAYSANPAGVLSALKVLSMHSGGRRLLITPGMVELADLHESENRKLGQAAAAHATDVILVGAARTQPIKDGLADAGFDMARVQVVETLAEAVTWYQAELRAGDSVLFLNDLPDTY